MAMVCVSKTKWRKKGYIRSDWLICRSDEDDSVAVAKICQNVMQVSAKTLVVVRKTKSKEGIRTR